MHHVSVRWAREIHDQGMYHLQQETLLFLKRGKDGQFTGTHYGRSYWPVLMSKSRVFVIPYVYPLTKAILPEGFPMSQARVFCWHLRPDDRWAITDVLLKSDVIDYIDAQEAESD